MKTNTDRLKPTDPMPFGKYRGIAMEKVPHYYLLLLYNSYIEKAKTGEEIRGDSHSILLYVEDIGVKNLQP